MKQVSDMFSVLFGVMVLKSAVAFGNECPQPFPISHGNYEFIDSPLWPETLCRVQYSCELGYQLNGTGMIYCFHSEWVGETPVCKEIRCGELRAPINGSMSFIDNRAPKNYLDSIVEFRCDEGFELVGEVSLICLKKGKWSATVPACVTMACETEDVIVYDLDEYVQAIPEFMTQLRSKDNEIYSGFYRYNYDGWSPNEIVDGGYDMYDGGNQIWVSEQYDDEVHLDYGNITTFPGMNFVAAVDDSGYPFYTMIAVTPSDDLRPIQLTVRGNGGADGGGIISHLNATLNLTTSLSPERYTFKYVVNQISGTTDPSICEVFLVGGPRMEIEDATLDTSFSGNTDRLNSRLSVTRSDHQTFAFYIVYALLSKERGVQVVQTEIENVLGAIVETMFEEFPDLT